LAYERGVGEGGGVDADFVGSGFEDGCGIGCGANASADGEGDEEGLRGAADGFEERGAALVRGGDVKEDNFVCALLGVAVGECGWVSGVDEVEELDAFDDAAVANVEAGYDAAGQHVLLFPSGAKAPHSWAF
jgi:hypothetical protein